MYGKSFESMFEGSMVGAGLNVFAVWGYIITKAKRGFIEINPKLLAFTLGGSEVEVQAALDFLQQADLNSRSKLDEGRRLVKEGQFQYRVVNWEIYDEIKNEIERRDYNRVRQQQFRDRQQTATDVHKSPSPSVNVQPPREKFIKPTMEEVHLAAAKIGLSELEAAKFFSHYEANGWRVGKNPMKNWSHALSGWKMRSQEYGNDRSTSKPNPRNIGMPSTTEQASARLLAELRERGESPV